MKELQNFIYKHMDSLKQHKRYLAMLTALSLLVTFIVPLILIEPADSMAGELVCTKYEHTHNDECYEKGCNIEEHIHTDECYKKVSLLSLKGSSSSGTSHADNIDVSNAGGGYNEDTGSYDSEDGNEVDGVTYNPATLPLYTLLFGEGENHWVNPNKSVEENLEIVDDEYFLGFASDFCAFIESDFTATDADAEGRIFIGGDLTFKNNWNYQVGAGDYGQFKSIWNTDEYGHLKGFASGIIGGKVYRLATMTTGAYSSLSHDTSGILDRHIDKKQNDVFLYPEEGAYKRFIVGNLNASLHYDEDYKTRGDEEKIDLPYEESCNHLYYDQGCTICGTSDKHDYLGEVNELSQFYLYDDVSAILEKTFDTLRARSLSLASVQAIDATIDNNGTLSLDASDIGDAKTVYFKINKWENVKRVVITVPDDRITYTETGDIEVKYSNGNKTIKNLDLNIIITCGDEEIKITQNVPTFILAKTANEKPDGDDSGSYGYKISNRGRDDGGNATNNHPVSSNILYNFYNAEKVTFTGDTNFNGTIFAPNANVTAPEACRGHLSGALIAKSFYGGLEFGYRPYRGGVDIFGMTSGYAIPVNKFDENGSVLPGALFAIKQDGKFVSLFESGDGTNFAALPSRVDFTGNTLYEQDDVQYYTDQPKPYAGTAVDGKQLTASVTIDLYKYPSCNENDKIESGDTLDNVYTKLYLKANQDVNIDSNENYIVTGPENGVYTIHLIKPAESLEITARNQGDSTCSASATVTFTPKMALNVTSTDFEVNKQISFNVSEPPAGGDTIYYKYFVNGNVINNDYYEQNSSCTYTPNAAGDYIFSVKAYVKNGENYCEVAQATANKVTIKEVDFPTEMSIKLTDKDGDELLNGTITSGNNIFVNLITNDTGFDGKVEYSFNNGAYQPENEFSTQGIVGKDLVVKVRVTVGENDSKKSVELYDIITVNFNENDGLALKVTGCEEKDSKLVYIVPSNDQISFSVNNISYYSASNPTITYYFNNTNCNGNTVDKTVVGDGIPVYAIISANGLEKKLNGFSLTGKYHDQLGLEVDGGTCTVGDEMKLTVSNAPNGASVVFRAFDANGNVVWSSDGQTVNNGGCSVSFTPDKAGDYTFKAYMTFASNPVVELQGSTVTVNAMPVKGELSVTPNQVNVGNNVELKVYAATSGANVVFTLRDQYGNTVKTFNGTVGENGECIVYYTPDQAGSFSVHTLITKDGSERQIQQSLNVNENTTTLTGEFTVENTSLTPTPDSRAKVKVFNATNGAVVNVYITYADGSTQHQSGNINNGVYEYEFPTTAAGSYSVKVTLAQNGTTLDLGERKFTISNGNDVSGNISVSSNSVLPKVPLNVNITSAPAGADVTFKFYYYGNLIETQAGKTVNSDGTCTVEFAPLIVGNYQVEAVISTSDGNVRTIETSFKSDAQFTLDRENHTYYGGDPCTITVDKVDSQTIGSVQKFTINGADVSPYTVDGKTIKFDTLAGYSGTFELYLRIQLSGGAVTEFRTSITMVNSSASGQNAPFALRYVRIDAEDMDSASNQEPLVIKAPDNESISSVRLVFPSNIDASQAKFTISAAFNGTFNGNSNNTRTKTYSEKDVVNNEIVISGSDITDITDITKIELTPVAGSITIDKYYPTYVKKENKITQTYAQDFTLEQYEEKEIVLGDWVKTLDSIVITLDEISNGNEGDVYYAFIHKDVTTAPEFSKAEVSGNQIKIENINADDIEKIKIYTTKSSLTFTDYTISSFVGSDSYTADQIEALKESLKTKTQDITSIYTLVEQQAPAGYFKENTVYIVEVKETIDLASFANGDAPSKVRTTVNVKTTDGITVLNYTVDITNNDNTRTIEFIDEDGDVDTFTVTKNTLTVARGDVTLDWDTTKPAQHGDYYFDPNAMMIVPVPAPIEYTNKIGLLFRKIDDKGAAVKGVDISLVPDPDVVEDVDVWYWDEKSSEWLIDYTKLKFNVVYKISETYAGGKYELAEDIYFQKTGTTKKVTTETGETEEIDDKKQIKYWTGSATMPDDANVLVFGTNLETRVIRMENTQVIGIKPKLKKTDMDGIKIDGSAKFALYAADGTELLNPINVVNGEVDFNFDPNGAYDIKYVEDGYLKPGSYYLQELEAPSEYGAATRSFGFEIVKNDEGVFKIIPSNPGMGETIGDIAWSTQTKPDYTIDELTFYYADGTFKKNSKVVEVTGNTYWYTLDYVGAGLNPKNVVGIKLKVGGSGDAKKFMIRDIGNQKGDELWGEIKDTENGDYTNVSPGIEYKFGNVPDDNNPITVDPKPTIDVDSRNTILISNKPLSNTMNLRVDKKWVGDTGITELRQPVEVQLMQKAGENGEYVQYTPPTANETESDTSTDTPTENETEGTTVSGRVTLNKANNWTYVWEDLPRYVNGTDDTEGLYYYKINEITQIKGYTSSVIGKDINTGGTIIIKNTAETVDIPIEKSWSLDHEKYKNVTIPNTAKFELQVFDEDTSKWVPVPGKTLQIKGTGTEWQGKFTGLIAGYKYRVVEVNVPYGWNPTYNEANNEANVEVPENPEDLAENTKFKVTNTYFVEEGSIALQKLWIDKDDTAALPYEIYLNLYRSVVAPSYTKTNAPYTDNPNGNGESVDYKTDYARLLQHSLYFYDANMCGTDVAENSALAWRTNCHVEDEVPGGYHDAGDHVMFGLPQGYTASMLGWTYYEFFRGGGVKEVNAADKEHLKVILERFYDFFVDSVKYDSDGKISKLLVQKGDGNVDHSYWGAPERQTERKTTGEDNEMYWSDYGADIASEYAAALALGYLNFYDNVSNEDKAKYENYLKVAKDLYEFAERNPSAFNEWGVNKDETQINVQYPGFYDSQTCNDDMALAAGWLHLADPDGGYKAKFENLSKNDDKWFSWNDVSIAAYAVGAHIESNTWSTFADKINGKIDENDPTKYFKQDNWGSARYNAIMQTAALVAAKHGQNEETYKTWAQGQMNLLLGGNSWKNTLNGVCDGGTVSGTTSPICLVTNFVPDGVNVDTPQAPHHRAASGWDSLDEYKVNCGYDDDSYALIGAMVGGPAFGNHDDGKQQQMYAYNHDHPLANHDYIDCLHDYCCNEVSIDYNAGLVGAAAGLYYFNGTGARSTEIEGVEYGAYGLIPPAATDNGIASPTKSAVSEAAQRVLLEEVANEYLYGMKQSRVSVLEDSTDVKYISYVVNGYNHNTEYNYDVADLLDGYTIDNVKFIFDKGGTFAGFTYFNSKQENKWQSSKTIESDGVFEHPENLTPETITNVNFKSWQDNLTLKEIRFYYSKEPEMSISGNNKVVLGNELQLGYKHTPENVIKYKWTSSNKTIATIDSSGKVTPIKSGELEITLEVYDNEAMSGDPLATASKSITVVESVTFTERLGTLSNHTNKDFKLSDYLPSGAILKSVSINVSPKDGNAINGFGGGLMVGDEETKNPWNQQDFNVNLNSGGQTFTLEGEYMNGVDCSIHKFTLGLWGADGTVNINSLTFEYIMDSTFIEIYYTDENERDSKIIRNGESVEFEVKATGGTIGGVQLKNGETVIETYEVIDDETFSLTISPKPGSYTIVAAMGGDNSSKTDSIALTVKDKITINGNELMDLGGSQTLTVNNAIGNITWSVEGVEDTDSDIITLTNGATFNTKTGKVTAGSSGREFTIIATDSYDGNQSSITISISERPKVPELPKDVFLEMVTTITLNADNSWGDNSWGKELDGLPLYDAKGNKYYYYIQESGYKQNSTSDYKALTDQSGHFIYSKDASYMPSGYYNNGILPVEDGTINIATVGNKFVSKQQGQLPSTGGSGVKTYYYFGGVMMLLGIAGFTGLKRRERKRRKG